MEFTQKIYEDLRTEKNSLNEEVMKLREEKVISEAKAKQLDEEVTKKNAEIVSLTEELAKSKELEVEKNQISEELTTIKNHLKECEIEDITTLKEDLEKSGSLLEAYAKLGRPEQIERKVKKLSEENEKWSELGELDSIVEAIPVIEYVLEETVNLGIPLSEVKEIISRAEHLVNEEKTKQNENLVLSISREYNAPIENVRSMLETLGEVQTVGILQSLNLKNKKIVKEEVRIEEKKVVEKKQQQSLKEDKPPVYNLFRQYKNEKTK